MPAPITSNIINEDLQGRFTGSSTIIASPAAAAETIIASVNTPNFGDTAILSGVRIQAFAAFTVGTNGTAVTFRIRQTGLAGNVVQSTGALSATAANLDSRAMIAFDPAPGAAVYVLTMQVTAGSAASTVSALHISINLV